MLLYHTLSGELLISGIGPGCELAEQQLFWWRVELCFLTWLLQMKALSPKSLFLLGWFGSNQIKLIWMISCSKHPSRDSFISDILLEDYSMMWWPRRQGLECAFVQLIDGLGKQHYGMIKTVYVHIWPFWVLKDKVKTFKKLYAVKLHSCKHSSSS